jgi:predicted kinase
MNKEIYTLIGPAANGKSTYANKIINNFTQAYFDKYAGSGNTGYAYFNADLIREKLYGDASIQGNGTEVFNLLFNMYVERLKDDKTDLIIIDNTSLTYKLRKRYYKLADTICPMFENTFNYNLVFFNTPIEQALVWNSGRIRHVPEDVIKSQYERYQKANEKEIELVNNNIGFNIIEIPYDIHS